MSERGNPHPAAVWSHRKNLLRKIADRGGNWKRVAKAWGTSEPYANLESWKRFPELAKRLIDNNQSRANCLSATEIHRRLRVAASGKSLRICAIHLGISHAALLMTIQRHAPDGVENALADFDQSDQPKRRRAA